LNSGHGVTNNKRKKKKVEKIQKKIETGVLRQMTARMEGEE